MKAKLNFLIFSSALLGFKLILIFKASKTSADPQLEETALLPCLATLIPILDKTIAAAVEIFSEFWPSPPVPQVSIVLGSELTLLALSLKT